MIKKPAKYLVISILLLLFTACSSMLPSANKWVKTPYDSFEEAKNAFDKIAVKKTTAQDLKNLGFDPFTVDNIEILNYLDILQRFMPNPSIKAADLDESLRQCLSVKSSCRAYEVHLLRVHNERYGNVVLDILNFRRNTKSSGWEFKALIVLQEDLVVYKIWSGKPSIRETEKKKNPLGPVQTSEDFVLDAMIK